MATVASVGAFRDGWYRIPDAAGVWFVHGVWYEWRHGEMFGPCCGCLSDFADGAQSEEEAKRLVRQRARKRGYRRIEFQTVQRQRYICFIQQPTAEALAAHGLTAADWLPARPADAWA